jgi:hypothetical protein
MSAITVSNEGFNQNEEKIFLILCCILNEVNKARVMKERAVVEINNEVFIYSSKHSNIKHTNSLTQQIKLKMPLRFT